MGRGLTPQSNSSSGAPPAARAAGQRPHPSPEASSPGALMPHPGRTGPLILPTGRAPVAMGVARLPSERVFAALYRISEATQTAEDLDDLYRHIHAAVGELMPALNFYIALYDEASDTLTFPYNADEVDGDSVPVHPGRSLTGFVLRTGRPLLASQEVFDQLVALGEVELVGAPSYDWMGVPLRANRQNIGVMAVQTYTSNLRYTLEDLEALAFVSTQVGMAIERKRAQDALRAGEERYRLLFENAPVGILVVSDAGRVLEVNPAALQILGSPSADATRTLNILQSQSLEACGFSHNFRLCIRAGQRIQAECPYTSRWGKSLFVHYYLEPLLDAQGRVHAVQVQIEDITPRKLAEEQAGLLHRENAGLLERMQAQNASLVEAYEATIEGWSRALEMRDKETKGHSERVTRMSLRLARRLGVHGEALVDLRRGVLLHDIGKMVTPDHILLKPGPLNDDEWKIMRQHPTYAYQMLCDIPFLAHALDIPWAHHENYDGTGYPRGLQGEAIPFGARVFALVDVWDALTSDRPYRPAWPPEAAIAFIVGQSGKRFDPRITAEFLRMLQEDGINE